MTSLEYCLTVDYTLKISTFPIACIRMLHFVRKLPAPKRELLVTGGLVNQIG